MTIDLMQTWGAVTGIAGALLVTSLSQNRRCVAFLLWLTSNVALGAAYIELKAWPLLAMTAFYFATSAFGVWNNRPRKAT